MRLTLTSRLGNPATMIAAVAILASAARSEASQQGWGSWDNLSARLESTAADVLEAGGVEILDEYLAARVHLLEERSSHFSDAMALARSTRIPVVIGTPAQVRERVAHRFSLGERMAQGYLAEFLVRRVAPDSPNIDLIVIRIPLQDLQRVPWWRRIRGASVVQHWIDETVDAILIHEIWGHLTPILEAGDYTGKCPDPVPGQPARDACVMQRENALRRELGLKPRTEYSISIR